MNFADTRLVSKRRITLCSTDQDKAVMLTMLFQRVLIQKHAGDSPFLVCTSQLLTATGIAKQLSNLSPSKVCGPDEISHRLLKIVASDQHYSTCSSNRMTRKQSQTNGDMDLSVSTRVDKKSVAANYRPISFMFTWSPRLPNSPWNPIVLGTSPGLSLH